MGKGVIVMEENKEVFSYTYSASQQAEIKGIREKYMPPTEEDKMERLRRLDRSVTKKQQEKVAPEIIKLSDELMK